MRQRTAKRLLVVAVLTVLPAIALAADRRIPNDTLQVRLGPATTHSLLVNGTEIWLASGARIYSDANRTIVPGRVPDNVIARIQPNDKGEIKAAWILTADEIVQEPPVVDTERIRVNPIRQ
ncbi:hypothetical protein BH10PSE17_BH10PSE17_29480 [soil metagenome]